MLHQPTPRCIRAANLNSPLHICYPTCYSQTTKTAKKVGKKNAIAKFSIECRQPLDDNVLNLAAFEKFFHDSIKVNNKAGNLGTKVTISKEKTRINVAAELPFSKRYLKYLTKKYLKKQQLRDYLRVVASGKNNYELKYYKINATSVDEE